MRVYSYAMNEKTFLAAPTAHGPVTRPHAALRRWLAAALLAAGVAFAYQPPAFAQDTMTTEALPLQSLEELEALVGPVALYPDDLLAIVLPASTYPLQVVEAARLLEAREAGAVVEPDENWDESVIALLNYPEALRLLNEDLDWTWALGEAVLAQQEDVIEAVERFRDQAYLAGNLTSDDHQRVSQDDGVIEIEAVEPDVIYVPYYDPADVIVRQPRRVYHYYPTAYPVYYYPYRSIAHFHGLGFYGVSSIFSISWHSRYVHLSFYDHFAHPYYGYYYAPDYFYRHYRAYDYQRYHRARVRHDGRGHYRWTPRPHRGSRPLRRHYDRERFIARSVERGRAERRVRSDGIRDQRRRSADRYTDGSRNRAVVAGQRQSAFTGNSPRRTGVDRERRRVEDGSDRRGIHSDALTRDRQTAFARNRAGDRPSSANRRYTTRGAADRAPDRARNRVQPNRDSAFRRAEPRAEPDRRVAKQQIRQRVEAPTQQRRAERVRSTAPSRATTPDKRSRPRAAPDRSSRDSAPRARARADRGGERRHTNRSSGRRDSRRR